MTPTFLVYDSRSGSTLLSREAAAQFPDVYVSPEIRLDPLLGRSAGWWQRAGDGRVFEILRRGRASDKLAMPGAELEQLAGRATGVRALVEAIATRAAAAEGRGPPAVALIKGGRHLRAAGRILADLPDARFVYVVRDPRAAIASKLATERPYVPGQKMAWAGAYAAAQQWCWYGRLARRLGGRAPLLAVRYEALLERPGDVLDELSRFLGVARRGGGARYRVPAAEQAVHGRVLAEGVDAARASAWRTELPAGDQAVIEAVCRREMRRWGYEPELRTGPLRAACIVGRSMAVSAWRVIKATLG